MSQLTVKEENLQSTLAAVLPHDEFFGLLQRDICAVVDFLCSSQLASDTGLALKFPAPAVRGSGECGVLYPAQPIDACSDLTNKVERLSNYSSPFVLIVRGGCSFEEKVRRAQKASFRAAIVYDNEVDGPLVASNDLLLHWVLFVDVFSLFLRHGVSLKSMLLVTWHDFCGDV